MRPVLRAARRRLPAPPRTPPRSPPGRVRRVPGGASALLRVPPAPAFARPGLGCRSPCPSGGGGCRGARGSGAGVGGGGVGTGLRGRGPACPLLELGSHEPAVLASAPPRQHSFPVRKGDQRRTSPSVGQSCCFLTNPSLSHWGPLAGSLQHGESTRQRAAHPCPSPAKSQDAPIPSEAKTVDSSAPHLSHGRADGCVGLGGSPFLPPEWALRPGC